jgi:hypothetical protein
MKEHLLEKFRERRDIWIACFDGGDDHCIMRQIRRMVWDQAAFLIVNKARQIAPRTDKGGIRMNGMLHNLFDRCFFDCQMLALRRLSDSSWIIDDPKKGVFSLCSLLDDVSKKADLMTRENILAAEELEYDFPEVFKRADSVNAGGKRDDDLERGSRSLERHLEIDRLVGVTADKRTRSDKVSPKLIDGLKKEVCSACEGFKVYVDKFIAHASTQASRQVVRAHTPTFGKLSDTQGRLCRVASYVGKFLLGRDEVQFLLFPIWLHNPLAYIEEPLVSPHRTGELQQAWKSYERKADQWATVGIDEFQ